MCAALTKVMYVSLAFCLFTCISVSFLCHGKARKRVKKVKMRKEEKKGKEESRVERKKGLIDRNRRRRRDPVLAYIGTSPSSWLLALGKLVALVEFVINERILLDTTDSFLHISFVLHHLSRVIVIPFRKRHADAHLFNEPRRSPGSPKSSSTS